MPWAFLFPQPAKLSLAGLLATLALPHALAERTQARDEYNSGLEVVLAGPRLRILHRLGDPQPETRWAAARSGGVHNGTRNDAISECGSVAGTFIFYFYIERFFFGDHIGMLFILLHTYNIRPTFPIYSFAFTTFAACTFTGS